MSEKWQNSKMFKKGLILIILISVLASTLAIQATKRIERQLKLDNQSALQSLLNSTNETLNLWSNNSLEGLNYIASSPSVKKHIFSLLQLPANKQALVTSQSQTQLRAILETKMRHLGVGFFIISPDKISLASMRDHNIGTANIIAKTHPEILDKVFQGQSAFVPPINSNINSIEQSNTKRLLGFATAFFIAPIYDDSGQVIAAISMRVDPLRTFSNIIRSGRIGQSGETYAFDNKGTLVSESRFNKNLEELALIAPGQSSILNISIMQNQTTNEPSLTRMAESAINGDSGGDMTGYLDYRNVKVVGVWLWNENLSLGLTTEMDYTEAFESLYDVEQTVLFLVLTIVTLTIAAILTSSVLSFRAQRSLNRTNADLEQEVAQRTKALLASKERNNKLLEATPDPMLVVNVDGKIEQINEATTRMFGYSEDELIGSAIDMLIPSKFHHVHTKHFGNYFKSPTRIKMTDRGDIEGVTKDGSLLIVEINLSPIAIKGKTLVIAGIRDITKQKQAEAQLVNAITIADEANKAKSDFLANMSHEIRTPMNAIIGMSHLALQTALNRKQQNYIEKVHRSAESLLGIINDILDFSKIEAGKLEIEQTEFYLDDVMHNLANIVGLRAEEKGLELHFNIASNVPSFMAGDPLRLGQILTNLGNNAVKFTPEGGQIVFNINVSSEQDMKTTLQFSVVDTGIGMSDEQLGRLFQSFSQADTSTTRKYGGTGLGLAISKKLTELMNGKIWVESIENEGSTFHFTADFSVAHEASPRKQQAISSLGELKVLVVDDNATAREILGSMLESFGMKPIITSTGQQAIDLLNKHDKTSPFEVAIIDWKMPILNGVETIANFQNNTELKNQPTVIMVTAFGKENVVNSATNVDISGFLTKPVTPSSLLDSIMLALGKEIITGRRNNLGQATASPAIEKLQGAKVLLVEDNEINQELALELLTENGLIVQVAEDGQQALDILATKEFDGVLMDCQMPVMDGYTATLHIRRDKTLSGLPIIAMTANAMAGDKEKVLACGMDDHISKPINVAAMFNTMAKWIIPSEPTAKNENTETSALTAEIVLPELKSLDVEKGLAGMQNNKKLFLKLLLRFREANYTFPQQFNDALNTSRQDAHRLAHTLKGTSGSIGAIDVQQAALKLEALSTPDNDITDISNALTEVTAQLSPVLSELAQLNDSQLHNTQAYGYPIDHKKLLIRLNDLHVLLEDYDTDATDIMEEIEPSISTLGFNDTFNSLAKAVDSYDFDSALEKLSELKTRCTEQVDQES
ncbi:response regulator [Pseudoalteromonas sp. C2R02]|uniref:response regulator n=1 Tax=Pseudoalteromonas sp. C2R02 TaxID=2841565 RepID=UPI001C0995CF|nr:response regulator [Pseudoalteromonas sp. C2R02]MBU2970750.1 response regulator [Pseudoalteromonas sp. C2R02]